MKAFFDFAIDVAVIGECDSTRLPVPRHDAAPSSMDGCAESYLLHGVALLPTPRALNVVHLTLVIHISRGAGCVLHSAQAVVVDHKLDDTREAQHHKVQRREAQQTHDKADAKVVGRAAHCDEHGRDDLEAEHPAQEALEQRVRDHEQQPASAVTSCSASPQLTTPVV